MIVRSSQRWKRAGQTTVAKPARNGVVVDFDLRGVEGGEGEGGVLFLMGATERDRQPIERLSDEIERCSAFRGPGTDDCLDFGQLPGGDDRNGWLDDAGLLAGDLGQTRAEPFLMIVIDRGEDGDDRLGGVGRVEASAHPGLEHDDLRFRISEMIERKSGGNFEESRMWFPSRDELTNFR